MYLAEGLQKKWAPVLEHPDMPKIKDPYRKAVTAVLLENQEIAMQEQDSQGQGFLSEAPANRASANDGNVAYADPVMISMIRYAMPNLMAYDVCGVQPMTGPTGLIFAMRAKYDTQDLADAVGSDTEPNVTHSGDAGDDMTNSGAAATGGAQGGSPALDITKGQGVSTATGEYFGITSTSGTAAEDFQQMAFSIDKVTVTAKTRALKGEYTMELAQDLKAVHGLDAETELANIISAEILAEINREVIRTIYFSAAHGAAHNTTTSGVFDLDTDSNGRWSVEKFKGLMFQIEREANAVAKATRRGKGNIIITSSDVASALAMAGVLDGGSIDDTANTFVGTLNGRYKVYIDPYFSASATNFFVVGYKGSSAYDAGLFYCPYVPLQMVRAVGENSFQPKIGFKTRYGMVANPNSNLGIDPFTGAIASGTNAYYRVVRVDNLM
ncbi:MAG: ATP-binding protein [Thaumarchaeota archaeon]|nr:ATP-binding protein [Nitrososphaerota archaeon]